MDKATITLKKLKEALQKALTLPSPKAPKALTLPKPPTTPSIKPVTTAPSSKKDPTNQAQQMEDPDAKAHALKMAKEKLVVKSNGQWDLN